MSAALKDVPRGKVPPYPEFVRHVWSYRSPGSGAPAIDPPPWVYSCLIEDPREWALVRAAIRRPIIRGSVDVRRFQIESSRTMCQVAFADLGTLHHFVALLSRHYESYGTDAARNVSEFVLFTLGFRWV